MKTLRVILAATLLFSSIGVTVVSVACAKASGRTTLTCQACKAAAQSKTRKSCCVYTVKHLSLKADFAKAQAPRSELAQIATVAVMAIVLQSTETASHSTLCNSSPPLPAVEKCALISTFRI
jgi:molybdopterin-guanine dinucleotide biosynthesis protein